jgi:hypothetical protein
MRLAKRFVATPTVNSEGLAAEYVGVDLITNFGRKAKKGRDLMRGIHDLFARLGY